MRKLGFELSDVGLDTSALESVHKMVARTELRDALEKVKKEKGF
jgi:hypothetical protein